MTQTAHVATVDSQPDDKWAGGLVFNVAAGDHSAAIVAALGDDNTQTWALSPMLDTAAIDPSTGNIGHPSVIVFGLGTLADPGVAPMSIAVQIAAGSGATDEIHAHVTLEYTDNLAAPQSVELAGSPVILNDPVGTNRLHFVNPNYVGSETVTFTVPVETVVDIDFTAPIQLRVEAILAEDE